MNNLKYVNVDLILENLIEKLPPNIKPDRERVIENIFIALKLMGLKQNNITDKLLYIDNNKVKLPVWIDSIEKVFYLNNVTDEDSFNNNKDYYINTASPMSLVSEFINERNTTDYKYIIRNGYIHTNIENGYIYLIYTSIPIDENGDPFIEDEINLINALVWYNVQEYMWKATVRNPQQFSAIYQEAKREWGYYSVNAKTASIFPKNEDSIRAFKNKHLRILPNENI